MEEDTPTQNYAAYEDPQPAQEYTSLDTPNPVAPVSQDVASQRAMKYHFGLGEKSPGLDVLHDGITNQNEQPIRDNIALQTDIQAQQDKQTILQDTAKQYGGNIPPDVGATSLAVLSHNPVSNPETILEKSYADKYVNTMATLDQSGESIFTQSVQELPHIAVDTFNASAGVKTRNEIAKKIAEDTEAKISDSSLLEKTGNFVEGFIPFWQAWHNYQSFKDKSDSGVVSSLLFPGTELDKNISDLNLLSNDDYHTRLKELVDTAYQSDPVTALRIAQAAVGYSTRDKFLDNFQGVADLASVVPAGWLVKGNNLFRGAAGVLKTAAKDTVIADAAMSTKPAEVLTQAGKIQEAGVVKAFNKLSGETEDISQVLPSYTNPDIYFKNRGAMSEVYANRLANEMKTKNAEVVTALQSSPRARRVPEEVLQQVGVPETINAVRDEFYRLNDSIIDFVHTPAEMSPKNVDFVSTIMGKPEGVLFDSPKQAAYYAKNQYGLGSGKDRLYDGIGQRGDKFFIHIDRPIDETTDSIRNALITTNNETPMSQKNILIGKVRSAEDLLPQFNRNNRKLATSAQQEIKAVLKEQAIASVKGLSKKSVNDITRAIEVNRDYQNPVLGKRGRYWTDQYDMETQFQSLHNRLPTNEESRAMWEFKRLNDTDWLVRNWNAHRDLGRMGITEHRFSVIGRNKQGPLPQTPFFQGKKVDNLDWKNKEEAGIWVQTGAKGKFIYKSAADKAEIEDLINTFGHKVVQVFDPAALPLKDYTGIKDTIHYVVTDSHQQRALSFKQIGYETGSHVVYADPYMIKQARIQAGRNGRPTYYGDTVIHSAGSEAEAKKAAESLEQARVMRNNQDPGLPNFLASNTPYTMKEWEEQFAKGYLDPNVPIIHTQSGLDTFATGSKMHTWAQDKDVFDMTRSSYSLAQNMDRTFLADRDLSIYQMRNTGTEANPLFKFEKSKVVDPFRILNQALGQSVRSMYMNDSKYGAVEGWLQEFGHLLNKNQDYVRGNPMYNFWNTELQQNTDRATVAAAKYARERIKNFLGQPTELSREVNHFQQQAANIVYNNAEKLGLNKQAATDIVQAHLLPKLKDPFVYARSFAFHLKESFFNPVAFAVQAQQAVHALLISPKAGLSGMSGWALHNVLRFTENPAIIAHVTNMAEMAGWKAGEFTLMREEMRKAGIMRVAGETAWRDDFFDPKLFRGTAGQMLDKSTFFFTEGERVGREIAYATAFKEWSQANPGKVINNYDRGAIMDRYDLMSGNMTRASSSWLQEGFRSVPTQFLTFNQRLGEQLLGKRLSIAEKSRVIGGYSLLYGVPVGATAGLISAIPGIPSSYDDIKQAFLEKGIDVDSTKLGEILFEGLGEAAIHMITGRQTDAGRRLGPGVSTALEDVISGNKTVMEAVFGASGKVASDAAKSLYPFYYGLKGLVTNQDNPYPLTIDTIADVARNATSVDTAYKVYFALTAGKLVNKSDQTVLGGAGEDKLNAVDATLLAFGLQPMAAVDSSLMMKAMKAQKDAQGYAMKQAEVSYDRAIAVIQEDPALARKYFQQVNAWVQLGDLNPEAQKSLWDRMSRNAGLSQAAKTQRDFWLRGPASRQQDRMKMIQDKQNEGN